MLAPFEPRLARRRALLGQPKTGFEIELRERKDANLDRVAIPRTLLGLASVCATKPTYTSSKQITDVLETYVEWVYGLTLAISVQVTPRTRVGSFRTNPPWR